MQCKCDDLQIEKHMKFQLAYRHETGLRQKYHSQLRERRRLQGMALPRSGLRYSRRTSFKYFGIPVNIFKKRENPSSPPPPTIFVKEIVPIASDVLIPPFASPCSVPSSCPFAIQNLLRYSIANSSIEIAY